MGAPNEDDRAIRGFRLQGSAWSLAAALWSIIYGALILSGYRFTTDLLDTGWQFPPRLHLATEPIRAALSTTVQPPLWNLVLGLTMRWSPLPVALSLQILMFCIGLMVVILAAKILRTLGVPVGLAVAVSVLAGLDPNLLGNLFTPAYELPTACLILAAVHAFPKGSRAATVRSLYCVAAAGTALVMVRTIFHPIWLVGLLVLSAVVHRRAVRPVHFVVSLAGPVALVLLIVVRNVVIMGTPAWTSWEGMNLLRSVQPANSSGELQQMFDEGRVSGVAQVVTFAEYDKYEAVVGPCERRGEGVLGGPFGPPSVSPFTGEPVAVPNFNSPCYGEVYRLARSDAWALILDHPDRWLAGRVVALRTWFTNFPASGASATIAGLGSVDVVPPGAAGWNSFRNSLVLDRALSLPQIALFVSLIVCSVAAVRRIRRGVRLPSDTVLLLACGFYVSAMAVGVVFELGEQSRFRWPVEPMVLVALAGQWARVVDRRPFLRRVRFGGRSTGAHGERDD